jgi:hypothetical protein
MAAEWLLSAVIITIATPTSVTLRRFDQRGMAC